MGEGKQNGGRHEASVRPGGAVLQQSLRVTARVPQSGLFGPARWL